MVVKGATGSHYINGFIGSTFKFNEIASVCFAKILIDHQKFSRWPCCHLASSPGPLTGCMHLPLWSHRFSFISPMRMRLSVTNSVLVHCNGNVILTKKSSTGTSEVIALTTSSITSDANFVNMTTLPFQFMVLSVFCIIDLQVSNFTGEPFGPSNNIVVMTIRYNRAIMICWGMWVEKMLFYCIS